jgi:hypothetical protein
MKFWEALYAIDRRVLYAILIVMCSWQVLQPIDVPNVPLPMSKAMYDYIDSLKEGDLVIVESDWTTSTEGESKGQFKALMRQLMRKKIRFVITSIDPLAPVIARLSIEEVIKEEPPSAYRYKDGVDYAIAGYFPNAENHVVGMVNNVVRELTPKGIPSKPVFQGIRDISDAKAVILATASSSITRWYERIRNKTVVGLMCTAVMAGENIPYYASGQLFGMVIGAKGAFDYETLLDEQYKEGGYINMQRGKRYMSPLFFALLLLILSVAVGNIAMFILRKRGNQQ